MLPMRGAAAWTVRAAARRGAGQARWESTEKTGVDVKKERGAGRSSGGSTDLKLDRETPKDSSKMIPLRMLGAIFGTMALLSCYVFTERWWYTRSIIKPMRDKYSDAAHKAEAWRDYDERQRELNRQKTFEDGLKPFFTIFPFKSTNWRRIPPPEQPHEKYAEPAKNDA